MNGTFATITPKSAGAGLPLIRTMSTLLVTVMLATCPVAVPILWKTGSAVAAEKIAQADQQDSDATTDQNDTASEVEPINPGEAVVTRFSRTTDDVDANGKPIKVIDINGTSASILDIRRPGEPAYGQHWIDEPQRMFVTAGEVGQVFGVAIADKEDGTPDIFLTATAAFGLHHISAGPGTSEWMAGMWGPDASPGTIYRMSADSGYLAEKFTDVKLDGRENSGASLGNIAYDKWHKRLFVSDLETGMIHSLDAETGDDLGHYDHGVDGRTSFVDASTGKRISLDPIAFDPTTRVEFSGCTGNFDKSPQCWNVADFRRRVWGLNVRQDENGETRLYYSIWGSDALGNPSWKAAGDDRRNSVWSIAINDQGLLDTDTARREFFMPAFWPADPALGDKAGNSNPVSDITFPECGPQNVMLVAERGGFRNLGLAAEEAFARPHQSRVIRFELGQDNIWRPKGRYETGFYNRGIKDGAPLLFASAAGGVDFGYKFGDDGSIDLTQPSQSVWMTGDSLCSPLGGCVDKDNGAGADQSEVHGLQGTPAEGFVPVESISDAAADALFQSYMIDADINVDENGTPIAEELKRNDATQIGDVAIYQACKAPALPVIEEEGNAPVLIPVEPPQDWPVHTLNMSHSKWSSSGHRVRLSWHWRGGSWHFSNRSWHWRQGSWHSANRSWHWRGGSWHDTDRSWHLKARSYHRKSRSWDGHVKNRSYHLRGRTWDNGHVKNRSFHAKGRTWDNGHVKDRSFHIKGRSWDAGKPNHVKGRSYHDKGRTWAGDDKPNHIRNRSYHQKRSSWNKEGTPAHIKGRSYHSKGESWDNNKTPAHSKKESRVTKDNTPKHLRRESRRDDLTPVHSKKESRASRDNTPKHSKKESRSLQHTEPKHLRRESRGENLVPQHSRRESRALNNANQPRHLKSQSRGNNLVPQHNRRASRQSQQQFQNPVHQDFSGARHRRRLSNMQ